MNIKIENDEKEYDVNRLDEIIHVKDPDRKGYDGSQEVKDKIGEFHFSHEMRKIKSG
jgi:hypothetical protein